LIGWEWRRVARWAVLAAFFLLLVTNRGFFARPPEGAAATEFVLQLKGSDTMVNLGQAWAERFMKLHPDAFIAVTGGGSGTGIAAFINGTADIAMSSRPMKAKEKELARVRGRPPVEIIAGLDGLAVVVHPQNPVDALSLEEIKAIFTGAVTNWREVGGEDLPIILMSRETASGTYVYFREQVLDNEEFAPHTLLLTSSHHVIEGVAASRGAIGYVGLGYLSDRVKAVAVAAEPGAEPVPPTEEAVKSGRYPVVRPLFLYAVENPKALAREFLQWTISPEGQAAVADVGYVPVR